MKIIVRPVGKDTFSGKLRYSKCFFDRGPYFTRSGSVYTGLTSEQARDLEQKLGYQEGTLSPASSYWETFRVRFTGTKDIELDTTSPMDELKYLFLKNHKNVANGLGDKKPNVQIMLINKDTEAREQNVVNKRKTDALIAFREMSLEDMRKCLRLYGVRPDSLSGEVIENILYTFIENDPKKYFDKWVNNKNRTTELLIEQALDKNVLRRNKNVYRYGTDIIGTSMEDTIYYLDNPSNQDIRIAIISELEGKGTIHGHTAMPKTEIIEDIIAKNSKESLVDDKLIYIDEIEVVNEPVSKKSKK